MGVTRQDSLTENGISEGNDITVMPTNNVDSVIENGIEIAEIPTNTIQPKITKWLGIDNENKIEMPKIEKTDDTNIQKIDKSEQKKITEWLSTELANKSNINVEIEIQENPEEIKENGEVPIDIIEQENAENKVENEI